MAMAMGGSRHSKISVKCQKKCGVSSESHEIWWNMIGIDDLFGVDHPILVSIFFFGCGYTRRCPQILNQHSVQPQGLALTVKTDSNSEDVPFSFSRSSIIHQECCPSKKTVHQKNRYIMGHEIMLGMI